jgi:hypothetical protein
MRASAAVESSCSSGTPGYAIILKVDISEIIDRTYTGEGVPSLVELR